TPPSPIAVPPACPILDAFCGAAAGYRSSNRCPPATIDLTHFSTVRVGRLGRARRLRLNHVFHQVLLYLVFIAKCLYAACGNVYWFKTKDVSVADFNLEAEPVGAKQSPGGIKSH